MAFEHRASSISFKIGFISILLLSISVGLAYPIRISEARSESKPDQSFSPLQTVQPGRQKLAQPIINRLLGPNESILFGRNDGFGGGHSNIFRTETTANSTPFNFFLPIDELEPSFSADGTKIVFVSRRDNFQPVGFTNDNDREIYIMNWDGTDQKRLTSNNLPEGQPTFSRDGTKIVYIGSADGGGFPVFGIYTMNVDGSNPTFIADETCGSPLGDRVQKRRKKGNDFYEELGEFDAPNFNADGSQIIFGLYAERVNRVNSDGTGCQTIYSNDNSFVPTQAVYSPDGSQVALVETDYDQNGNEFNYLRIIDDNGNQIQDIFATTFFSTPSWSPDGARIAYVSGDVNSGPDGIRTQAVLSTQNIQVVFNPAPGLYEGITWGTTGLPEVLRLSIDQPHPVPGGVSTQGKIQISPSIVPPGGATINLSITGNTGVLSLPQSTVFVPFGSFQATFPIDTLATSVNQSAEVRAEFNANVAEHTVSVLKTKADLTFTEFTAPANAQSGVPFDVTYKVKNIGSVATDNSWLERVRFSADNSIIGSRTNPGPLAPNEEVQVILPVTINAASVPADGDYTLIAQVNAQYTLGENDISNNHASTQIHVGLPDLIAENIVVPANSEPGEPYTVTWDVRNQGAVNAPASTTRFYFSPDSIAGNSDDIILDTVATNALTAGQAQSYSRPVAIPTLPVTPTGAAFFYAHVDLNNDVTEGTPAGAGETNNTTFASTQFVYRVPDLQIASISPPPEIETDTVTPLSWNTNNAGNKAAGPFYDQVFFSVDNQVGSDVFLGSFQLTGGLAAGTSVDRIQNISIPTDQVPSNGNYFIYVKTDAAFGVNEGANENNNITFQQVTIRKIDRPDLQVTNITAPSSAFFDQVIQLQWTVTNSGAGPTNAPNWKDRLFVGTNPNSLVGATFLVDSSSVSYLNVGESYIASATVRIPRGLNGSYHFLVAADYFNAVNEDDENNNLLSIPVTLNVPPLPDYVVTQVQAPDTAFAGAPIQIDWQVMNQGNGSNQRNNQGAFPNSIDRVYLSQDTTLDLGIDRLIFTKTHSGELAANSTYSANTFDNSPNVQQFVNLPDNIQGQWYAFVVTDATDQVYEFTNEGNNAEYDQTAPGSPINILATPPDLIISGQPTAPATAMGGEFIDVSYVAENQGAFDTNSNWLDAIYLSNDQTFDSGDTLLGNSGLRNALAAGSQQVIDISVRLPNCITGTYYLFAVTDYTDTQYEFDPNINAEANNVSLFSQIQITSNPPDLQISNFQIPSISNPGQVISISYSVINNGGDSPNTNWTDRITLVSNTGLPVQQLGTFTRTGGLASGASYTVNADVTLPSFMEGDYFLKVTADYNDVLEECGAEANNEANSASFTVSNNLPDLQIDTVTVPGTAQVGGTINVQWTGRNAGQAMNPNPGWNDRIYLSSDPTYSIGDSSVGNELIQLVLTAGGTYQRQKQVTIPNLPAGTYYVLVFADRNNNVNEGTSANPFEQNNVTASIPITLTAPGVDLRVSNLTASTPTYSGRTVNVTWDVTNFGTSDTLTGIWTDYVILSRDSVIDSADRTLGYRSRSAVLGAGLTYQESQNYLIPSGLTGDYKILVHTDLHNTVVENDDGNNISTPLSVNLTLPPPADLSITNITAPATINLDNPAGIQWTVMNSGPDMAIGTWRDSVYISQDQFWDATDFLVGQAEQSNTNLDIGSTYTASLNTSQLFVEEGDYYIIVRTDARNAIRESNEANNISTSISQSTVTITQLQIDTPFNTTLGDGRQKVFKFDPPSNETLVVSLLGEPGNPNELFSKFDTIVSRADYDYQGTRPGEPDQENVIPDSGTGTYYSLVSNDFVPQSFADAFDKAPKELKAKGSVADKRPGVVDQNISIKAEVIPFSIRKVTPATAGNQGFATLVIDGAKYQDGATAKLVANDGSEIDGVQSKNSVNTVATLFDLQGKTPGFYDLVVTNPDNATAILTDGFEIVQGGGFSLRPGVLGPQRIGFAPGNVRYTFSAINDGQNDALDVPLIVAMPGLFNYQVDNSNLIGIPDEFFPDGNRPLENLPFQFDFEGKRLLFFVIPILQAKSSVEINIDIQVPGFVSFRLEAAVLEPLPDIMKKIVNVDPGDPTNFTLNVASSGGDAACIAEVLRQGLFALLGEAIGAAKLKNCANALLAALNGGTSILTGAALSRHTSGSVSKPGAAVAGVGWIAGVFANMAKCAGATIPFFRAISLAITIGRILYQLAKCLCIELYWDVSRAGSIDPNEKLEPTGYGPEKFVGKEMPLLYRINFENLPDATAPAQRINIIDQLPATLDPRTVRIKEIGFKQYRFLAPENQAFFQQRVQLGADVNNLKADISAGLDIANGRIFWTLTAIDPTTGERPTDPLEGILPPNNANQDGEGYVTFTVEPMAGQVTRTEINNVATIIFDENEPIVTNTTSNLLDSGVPTSSVASLPVTIDTPSIPLIWNGSEDVNGSGLRGYNILVSEDGGPYTMIAPNTLNTSDTFVGKWGKDYRFYSIASDNAGNVELPPSTPDASITVLGGATEADLAPRPNGSDGTVDGTDTAQVRRFAAGLDTDFTYNEFQRADSAPLAQGGNGSLTIADVVQTRRYVDGLDPIAPAIGPNASMPLRRKTNRGKKDGLLPRELRPVRVTRVANQLLLAIELESQGDEVGLGFTINYDPAVLSNPINGNAGTDVPGANVTLNTSQANTGNVGVLIDNAPTQPIAAGTRQVFTIIFDIATGSPVSTVVNLTGVPVVSEVVDGAANPLTTTFSSGTIQLLGPTAANVSVSGRVRTTSGRQVYNAIVTMTDSSGSQRMARTNQFGRYRIDGITAGGDYVFTVQARGYQPITQIQTVSDDITGLDFQLEESGLETKEPGKPRAPVPRSSKPEERIASP